MTIHKQVKTVETYVDGKITYKVVETTVQSGNTRNVSTVDYDYSTQPATTSGKFQNSVSSDTRGIESLSFGSSTGPHLHFQTDTEKLKTSSDEGNVKAEKIDDSKVKNEPTLDELITEFLAPVENGLNRFAKAVDEFSKEFVKEYKKAKAEAEEAKEYKKKH